MAISDRNIKTYPLCPKKFHYSQEGGLVVTNQITQPNRKVQILQYNPLNKKLIPTQTGTFLGWGVDYEELDGGPGNFTAAIVELPCGQTKLVHANLIKFLP